MKIEHIPVLPVEVVEFLPCRDGALIVDCTLGGGGHAEAILEKITPAGFLLGIDKDIVAINAAKIKLKNRFGRQSKLIKGDFRDLSKILQEANIRAVDGILFDLGVSSLQIDILERGFSYRFNGPLDMRMNNQARLTAAEVVNLYSEERLAMIIRDYGEERWAKRIARFIVEARRRKPITSTRQLVEIIKAAIPASARRRGGHPAKQTFQALRIEVNDELKTLEKALPEAIEALRSGGRLAVISYHSLEDRIVKNIFKKMAQGCICPPELPSCQCGRKPVLKIITKRPVVPSVREIAFNPRARGAKLRVAEKI